MTDNSAIVWDIVIRAVESGEWSMPDAPDAPDAVEASGSPADGATDQDPHLLDDCADVAGYWQRGDPPPTNQGIAGQWWSGDQGGRQRGGFDLFSFGGQQQFSP